MGAECTPAATAMRLTLARAVALGVQDAAQYIGLSVDDPAPTEREPEDVLVIAWPEHDPACECEASKEVVEAYGVAWLEELEAIAEDKDAA